MIAIKKIKLLILFICILCSCDKHNILENSITITQKEGVLIYDAEDNVVKWDGIWATSWNLILNSPDRRDIAVTYNLDEDIMIIISNQIIIELIPINFKGDFDIDYISENKIIIDYPRYGEHFIRNEWFQFEITINYIN